MQHTLTNGRVLTVESVRAPGWTLQSCEAVCSDVLFCSYLFTARPLGAVVDGSLDLPRIGRSLHRRSRKAGLVPRPQFILLIEPDDDSRVTYAEYQDTFGFTVLTADTTDHGLTRATS
jgi:hypothetical protein